MRLVTGHLQDELYLIPDWVQIGLDRLGLLLVGVSRLRNQLDLDVRIAQSVRIHWDKVACFDHWNEKTIINWVPP